MQFLRVSFFIATILIIVLFTHISYAGSLSPSVFPTNSMYTLDGIYNKIINNSTDVSEGAQSFTTPNLTASSFHSLKEIYESIPTIDKRDIKNGTTYMGVSGNLYTATSDMGLPKTNQTTCWNPSDPSITIACSGTGQDGDYQKGASPSIGTRFTDNNDNTISDNVTMLMWKKCTEGLSGSTCATGSGIVTNWSNAIAICEADTTAGFTDWRMPNIRELISIIDYKQASVGTPAIDATYFPNTKTDTDYFSSTSFSVSGNTQNAWTVYFLNGNVQGAGKDPNSIASYVRCVR